MRKLHSILLGCIAVLSFALAPTKAKATHAAGGEVIYEWISDSTYRIYFKFYRDCTGAGEPNPSHSICVTNGCGIGGSSTGGQNAPKWNGALPGGYDNGTSVSAGCSQYKNSCDSQGSTVPGYREWWYYILWTSPGKCESWNFSATVSARNNSWNIVPTTGSDLYVETTFDNLRFEENSSPFFSVKPIPYVCINQKMSFNNGAIDPDGDSLWSEMVRPLWGSCGTGTPMTWGTPPAGSPAFGLPSNPLSTNNTFVLAGRSGQMTFTANQQGASTITTKVTEYKIAAGHPYRGRKIGYIMRDVQVQVLPCSVTAPDVVIDERNIVGGGVLNSRINGCIGQPLKFDFWVKSSDTEAVLTVEDNSIYQLPTAKITYTNLKNDSIHGHFEWLPGMADGGTTKGFIVTTKDSTCKPPGIMLYYPAGIEIYIWPATRTVPDTAVCPGETAFLTAEGGENYEWSVLSGGPITQLNCVNCKSPIATTTEKTTYMVTSKASSFCNNNKDTVTVDLLPGLLFTPLKDDTTCLENPITLDLKTTPPSGVKYIARWNTKLYLSDSVNSKVISTPKASIQYTVVLTSTANLCKGFDTVNVDVLSGFKLDNVDTFICKEQSVDVRSTADSRYKPEWTVNKGSTNIFSDPLGLTPTINPLDAGKATYTMTLRYKNCRDTSVSFNIDVQPVPIVTIDNDVATCFGDTVQLNGKITPADFPFDLTWTPGSTLTDPKIANPIFSAKQTTKLVLVAKAKEAGCSDSDTMDITVFPNTFLFASNDTAICPGESAQLKVEGKGVKSFRWIPDIRISNSYSENPVVSPSVTQEYKVYGVDTNFCSDTQKVLVTVHPKAVVSVPDSVRIYPGQSYQFEPGGNCSYFTWFPPLGLNKANISNPISQPEVNTRYFVTGVTEMGCSASDSISVMVSSESLVDVPNGFTPGSGPNGKFRVVHMGDASLKNFTIYNRWGVKVYESADINEGWDGTFKNEPQPMGVYIYNVEVVTPTGRKFTKQGNVTLVR